MRILLIGFMAILFCACGKQRAELLSERANKYNRAIRWSSPSAAGTLIDEEVRRSIMASIMKQMNGARIVDFSILDLGLDKEQKNASILVEFSFYRDIDQTLRYRQELQQWKFQKNDWFLTAVTELREPQ